MALKLMYISNNVEVAQIAQNCGVDWIFIDLEIIGKDARQGHLDTVISRHSVDDVKKIKSVLNKSKLLVRVNPIHDESKVEIDTVINNGADIVMLPYFKSRQEVERFIGFVGGRSQVCLLLETPEAVEDIDSILETTGIDFIHIGLNDLHLGYKLKFMFELLADGTVERICDKIRPKNIPYGFGGIARLGQGDLPAEYIVAEHYRLGSSMAILSRSFLNHKISDLDTAEKTFCHGIKEIRDLEKRLSNHNKDYFERNRAIVKDKVRKICDRKAD